MEGINKKLEELIKLREETFKQINQLSADLDISKANYQRIDGAIFVLEEILNPKEDIKA